MGEFKHLVIAKFKEGVNVEEIVEQVKKMVSDIDSVKSFEWGHDDVEGHDTITQGFTHVFSMTFDNKEGISSFLTHPKHVEFTPTFSAAIDKIVVLDFPFIIVKPPAQVLPPPLPMTSTLEADETAPTPPGLLPVPTPPIEPVDVSVSASPSAAASTSSAPDSVSVSASASAPV